MELISWADLILVMEPRHAEVLCRLSAAARSKTFLLGHFAASAITHIRDPYNGTAEDFNRCYAIIADCCEGLIARITGLGSQTVVSYSR
jgi:protein-tyrosine-phosphatase